MVARLKPKSELSEVAFSQASSQTVSLSVDSQATSQNDGSAHDDSISLVGDADAASAQGNNVRSANPSSSPESASPSGPVGVAMSRQRRLFVDLPRPLNPGAEVLVPEQTKAGFKELLKPITRPTSFRAVSQLNGRLPVLVCVQRIQEAKKLSGLNNEQIGKLVGLHRDTVGKILRLEEGIGFHDWIAVMNVLDATTEEGLEIAELFPMRKKKRKAATKWPRGYVDVEMLRKPDVMAGMVRTKKFGNYLKRRKRWG